MNRRQAKYFFVVGLLLMITIQYIIRPAYHHHNWLKVVLGFSPNLLSAAFIPVLFFVIGGKMLPKVSMKSLLALHIIIAGLLCMYELLQMITVFGKTFDYLDLLATIIGTAVSLRLLLPWAGKQAIIKFSNKNVPVLSKAA
jgi:ABC-type protease/lipase transport system fused ATPase/permease subunit